MAVIGIKVTKSPALDAEPERLGLVRSEWYAWSLGHYEEAQATIETRTKVWGFLGTPVLLHLHQYEKPCNRSCLLIEMAEVKE